MVKVNDIIINIMNKRHCSTKCYCACEEGKYLFIIKPIDSADYFMQYFSNCTYPDVMKFCKDHDVQKREQYFVMNVKNTERQEIRK